MFFVEGKNLAEKIMEELKFKTKEKIEALYDMKVDFLKWYIPGKGEPIEEDEIKKTLEEKKEILKKSILKNFLTLLEKAHGEKLKEIKN